MKHAPARMYQRGHLPDEFTANVTYKVFDLCGLFLRFKKDDNRSLWRISSAPLSRLPYQTAHSRLFQPVARDPAVPTKIAALGAVFEKLQSDQLRGLKRKLEETTLAMERARMEREDFRQDVGPCYMANEPQNCTWRRRGKTLLHEALGLKEEKDELLGEIAVARNVWDNSFGRMGNVGPVRVARCVLDNALPLADSD